MRNLTLTDVKEFVKRHDLNLGPATREGHYIFRSVRTYWGDLIFTYVCYTPTGHKYFRVPYWRGIVEGCYHKAHTLHTFETYYYGEDL